MLLIMGMGLALGGFSIAIVNFFRYLIYVLILWGSINLARLLVKK
ncbi:MAG: hypothetical protein ABIH25_01330 [Candidatus Woesearchaeota archaeon]